MTRKPQASYTPEFKHEAARLLLQGNKEAAQLARLLAVASNEL